MTKFHEDRRNIVDFSLIVIFLASPENTCSPSKYVAHTHSEKSSEVRELHLCPEKSRNLAQFVIERSLFASWDSSRKEARFSKLCEVESEEATTIPCLLLSQ